MATSKDNGAEPDKSKADQLPDVEPVEGETAATDDNLLGEVEDSLNKPADDNIFGEDFDDALDEPEPPADEEIIEAEFEDTLLEAENALTEDGFSENEPADEIVADSAVTDAPETVEEVVKEEPVYDTPAPVAAPPAKGGGFWGGMFGGLVAAAIGFGTSRYMTQDWPFGTGAQIDYQGLIDGQTEQIEAQSTALETQGAVVEELSTRLTDTTEQLDAARAEIESLRGEQDSAVEQIGALAARFEGLSEIEVGELPSDVQDLINQQREQIASLQEDLGDVTKVAREQIGSLQTEIDSISTLANTQIATAEEVKAQAEKAAAEAKARGAINDISTALANGGPFADALPVIAPAVEVPAALSDVAETGVATVQNLQNQFPDAARTALSTTTRAEAPEGLVGRLQVFAKDQLGARSLAPREGDDPDAVLSRAEAAVRSGELPTAIELVGALPEIAQEPFADWISQAQARIDAQGALATLTEALGAD